MAPKSAMDELLKRRNALQSKLFRTLEDAEVLANAPIDFYAVKIEMGRLGILGATFQALENEILVTCPQQEFYAQQAELTSMLNLYKSIKLKLMKLLNCDDTPVQLPAVPDLCQPHHHAPPNQELFPPPKDQRDEQAATLLEGVNTTNDDLLNQPSALISSSKSPEPCADPNREYLHPSKILCLPSRHWDIVMCRIVSIKLNPGIEIPWLQTFISTTAAFVPEKNFTEPYHYTYAGT